MSMGGGGWMYATMAVAGIGIPVMAALNASLGRHVGAPTAAVVLFTAAIAVALVYAMTQGGLRLGALASAPRGLMWGGALIAFYVISITTLAPLIGVGTAVMLVLAGQIVSAALIDHFGLLGAPRTPIDATRALGVALMVAGVVLARRPEG